jgi:hypothetical protein
VGDTVVGETVGICVGEAVPGCSKDDGGKNFFVRRFEPKEREKEREREREREKESERERERERERKRERIEKGDNISFF